MLLPSKSCARAKRRREQHARVFARAGDFARARALAAQATDQAAGLGSHRALHAGAAETSARVPGGRFEELLARTEGLAARALEDGDRTCATGMVALAGRALALFESGDREAAVEMVALLDRLTPSSWGLRRFADTVIELLRPVIGSEDSRRRMAAVERRQDATSRINRLRLELPLCAAAADWDSLDQMIGEARAIAGSACAPVIGWIADWAEATGLAGAGRHAEAAEQALAAAAALEGHGEGYTGARLLVDLLPLLDESAAGHVAERAAAALDGMGAQASAAEARAAYLTEATNPRTSAAGSE